MPTVRNKRYALLFFLVSVFATLIAVSTSDDEIDASDVVAALAAIAALYSLSCFVSLDFFSSQNCSLRNRRMLSFRSIRSAYGESVTVCQEDMSHKKNEHKNAIMFAITMHLYGESNVGQHELYTQFSISIESTMVHYE